MTLKEEKRVLHIKLNKKNSFNATTNNTKTLIFKKKYKNSAFGTVIGFNKALT
jgi:hypothetical protein